MKKYIIIAFAAAFAFVSCKGFLEEAPKLSQSDVLTLSTFDGLDMATAGAYAPLASSNWYGASFILSNEMQTMNGKRWGPMISKYESGRFKDEYSVHYSSNNTKALWGTAYFVILSCNSVINTIENEENGIVALTQDLDNLKAECLFLRALAHFDLVRTYAMPYNIAVAAGSKEPTCLGVPVVLTVDATAQPARETMVNTYKQIIDDLLEAERIIDPSYARAGGTDKYAKITITAIQALLSRVYLYSENWQEAANYATKVIESGEYSMWPAEKVANGTSSVWREEPRSKGEVIFEVYVNTTQTYGTGNENVCGMTSYMGYGDCGASTDLLNLYEDSDARKSLVSPDDKGDGLFTMKYFGKGLGTIDASNIIVLRLSEMYLNRAEAVLHGATSKVSAAEDLATIAKNRGASPLAPTLANVYTERAKEFAWEGHLWFDLARTGRDMTRTDVSGTSIPTNIPAGDYRWAMPIASREFTVNPNLVQNEGYSNK